MLGALTACGSQNNPPPASAASVEQATTTPATGPSFAPSTTDGTASAASDSQPGVKPASGFTGPDSPPPNSATAPAPDNVAATPTEPSSKPTLAPDNSRVNARDRSGQTLTPTDQGSSESDRKITQHVRQAVVKDSSLSFTAKNVKIITINGKVTLRGPVKSDAEKATIEAAARSVAGDGQVESFLEVKN